MNEELKPIRCGCGGEAKHYENPINGKVLLSCKSCGIETKFYDTEAEAVEAWNRAMSGSAEEKLKSFWDGMSAEMREERTAKVEKVTRVSSVIRTGRCGDCGYDVIDSYKHCPNCGAKLDWSGK